MPTAIERIVVQATPQDKQSIVDKAKRLDLPVSELMRRSALAYEATTDDDLEALAGAARRAAERAGAAIDDALAFIDASNRRIDAMEPVAVYKATRAAAPRAAAAPAPMKLATRAKATPPAKSTTRAKPPATASRRKAA